MSAEDLDLEVAVKGFTDFINKMGKMDRSIGKTGGLWEGLGGIASGTVAVALGNIVVKAAGAAVTALTAVGKATIGLVKDSTALAGEFQSMTVGLGIAAKAAIDLGETSFDQLHDAALEVGSDTRLLGVSATGAADSMTGLYKAGLTTTEIFGDLNAFMNEGAELGGALRASIDLAAASELDMVQASDLAATMLATFGGEMETAEERAEFVNMAMNNMVQAADASVAEVSGLAEALKMVGPAAGAAGMDVADVNNALALLSTRGIQGSMAGTSMNRMLLDLTKTTPKATDMLDDLGISIFDQQGAMRPLVDIIGQFEGALGDATDAERSAALQAIFTAQGQRAMNVLLEEGVGGWDEMAEATANAAGIQEQAAAKAATYEGQMEALEGTIETLKIGIGEAFLPVATDLVKWFSQMVDEHGPAIKQVFETIATAIQENLPAAIEFISSLLGERLPGAIGVLTAFWEGVLLPAITAVWAFIQENVIPVLTVLGEWLSQTLTIAIQVLADYWNTYLLPILAAYVEAWQTSVQPALAELWAWLQEKIPPAIAFLGEVWTTVLQPAMANLAEFVAGTLIPILGRVAAWLIKHIPVAIDAAAKFFKTVLWPALQTVWKFIKENVIPIIMEVVKWLQENIPVAIEAARAYWEEVLQPALQAVWKFIKESVIPIIETVVKWLQENIPKAIEEARRVWEEVLLPAITIVWTFIQEDLLPLFEALSEFLDATLGLTLTVLAGLWKNVLQPALQAVWEFIKDKLQPVFDALSAFWKNTLGPAISTLATLLKVTLLEAWRTATNAVEVARLSILVPLQRTFSSISGAIQSVIGWLSNMAAKISRIKIPDWLKGRSPPPLANWFGDIGASVAQLTRVELPRLQVQLQAAIQPVAQPVALAGQGGARGGGNVTQYYDQRNYNLTTQSTTRPGGLRLEFDAMSMASR